MPGVFGENANRIAAFLAPILPPVFHPGREAESAHHLPASTEWLLMGVSVAVALTGLFLAWKWYAKEGGRPAAALAARLSALHVLVAEAFRVDRLYDLLIVRPFVWLARRTNAASDPMTADEPATPAPEAAPLS